MKKWIEKAPKPAKTTTQEADDLFDEAPKKAAEEDDLFGDSPASSAAFFGASSNKSQPKAKK